MKEKEKAKFIRTTEAEVKRLGDYLQVCNYESTFSLSPPARTLHVSTNAYNRT